jgi:hypothetical protein
LQSKAAYRLTERLMIGLESYETFGPVQGFAPARQPQSLYVAADYETHGATINLGVGRGLTPASDGWTIKAVIGLPLGRRAAAD